MERQQQNHDPKTETNVGRAVMTDEQLETLRKQIAVYRIISQHLFETYKTLTATFQTQQDRALDTSGKTTMLSSTSGGGHKSKRQRWNPTSSQLQILESIFSKVRGLPSKQKTREIADELSQHGLVSETNVYNWFQNKRARSKRKKLLIKTTTTTAAVSSPPSNKEGDSNDDSVKKKDGDTDKTLMSPENEAPSCRIEELSHEINAELVHFINSRPPEVDSIFSNSSGGNVLSNNTGS